MRDSEYIYTTSGRRDLFLKVVKVTFSWEVGVVLFKRRFSSVSILMEDNTYFVIHSHASINIIFYHVVHAHLHQTQLLIPHKLFCY